MHPLCCLMLMLAYSNKDCLIPDSIATGSLSLLLRASLPTSIPFSFPILSFARDEKLSVLFDSQERILPSNLKKAYSLRVTADSTGCLFERRKPFERKMNVNVPGF